MFLLKSIQIFCTIFFSCLLGCSGSWKQYETPHLKIYYQKGSYAEKNLQQAATVYEENYRSIFEIAPVRERREKLALYLHEKYDAWGRSYPDRGELHYVFSEQRRLTSSHEMMHVFLHELNPHAPDALEEGVCRFYEARAIMVDGKRQNVPLYVLATRIPSKGRGVEAVFKQSYQSDNEGNLAAAFVAFYVAQKPDGALNRNSSFWMFYRKVKVQNWRETLEQEFGKGIQEIDADFQKFIAGLAGQ